MKVCPHCKTEYAGGEGFCPTDGARLATHSQMADPEGHDPLVGETLSDRYKIIRQIGEGGMGIVYEAMHVIIEKKVALKILRDDFSKKPEVVERFRQEAKSASRIGHQHIVDISDFGETPSGQSFFVMEYLVGQDLADILATEQTLSVERSASILMQCARALGAAHDKGIVHRDMKPENIFLINRGANEDFVKIVDFGIAKMSEIETEGAPGRKLTKTGMIFGTPEYMSPEQAAGKKLDHRVDIYAMGVIFFELLTGRVPFLGDTFMGVLTQHMFEPVPAFATVNSEVSIPDDVASVILRAMEKDPDDRYQTMEELALAIAGALDWSGGYAATTMVGYGEPVKSISAQRKTIQAIPAGPAFSHSKPRKGIWFGVAAAVAIAAVVLVALLLSGEPPARAELDNPEPTGDPVVSDAGSAPAPEPSEDSGAEAIGPGLVVPTDDQVTVTVTTVPRGAEVRVDGRGVVCPTTPCEFETNADEYLRIRTRRGRLSAVRDVSPSEDTSVELRLVREERRPQNDDNTDTPMGMRPGNPGSGDLKIPDIFR